MSTQAQEMTRTVAALAATGKGILAADESSGTIEKRFKAVNVPSTEQTRRDYREPASFLRDVGARRLALLLPSAQTARPKGR